MPMNGVGEQLRCGRFLRESAGSVSGRTTEAPCCGRAEESLALLISILNHLLRYNRFRRDPLRQELQSFIPRASTQVCNAIEDYFRSRTRSQGSDYFR